MGNKSALREWFEAILVALFLVAIVRVFIVDVFVVSSSSMEKTLLTGDFILVNKLSYGSRVPITPVFFPFSHQKLPFSESKSYWPEIQLPYFRLPGLDSIQRNDILVFNYPGETNHPVDQRTYFVKRCVALPGDTFEIHKANTKANNLELHPPKMIQYDYHVTTLDDGISQEVLNELNITEGGRIDKHNQFQLTLTNHAMLELKKNPAVSEIVWLMKPPNQASGHIFPYSPHFPWNRDNFGPLVVPKKGTTIALNTNNIALYKKIITQHEKKVLDIKENNVFINGKKADSYTFGMNYYFVLGDNRHNSGDSRAWGFLPENHIVGKAHSIIMSFKKNKKSFDNIRWKRFFESIN